MNTETQRKKHGNSRQDCRCSQCAACLDDARWERIFQAKFADPFYYNRNQARNSSPIIDM